MGRFLFLARGTRYSDRRLLGARVCRRFEAWDRTRNSKYRRSRLKTDPTRRNCGSYSIHLLRTYTALVHG